MLDLILLILLVWAFVRFYKSFSSGSRAFNKQMHNSGPARNSRTTFSQGGRNSFDDIEEAEYIEIKENDRESSNSNRS